MSDCVMESCKSINMEVEVQENGIIRDLRGWIVGRADNEWMRYQWRMMESGICPCCGKVVDDEVDEAAGTQV